MNRKNSQNNGFSLIELAAIIGIVASLAIGYLQWVQPAAKSDAKKIILTRDKMNTIVDMLVSYTVVHNRLPCPADPSLRVDDTRHADSTITGNFTFGSEALVYDAADGVDCPYSVGALPVNTLNLPADYMFDGWGRRFVYHVSPNLCGDDDNVVGLSAEQQPMVGCSSRDYLNGIDINASNTSGNLVIHDATGGDIATGVAFVLLSHGANGAGGYLDSGARLADSADNDELENSDSLSADPTDLIYVKKQTNATFDDILSYKTKDQIGSMAKSYVIRLLTKEECEANSAAIANMTINIATDLDTAIDEYKIDIDGGGVNFMNEGSALMLSLMWSMQAVCGHADYYGEVADGDGWNGLRCPGGAPPPIDGVCTCADGSWDGDCTP